MASSKPDALTQATRLLASTDKTAAQLIAALARRGHSQVEIDGALERARALGYLDDRRVAAKKAKDDLRAGWVGEALLARLTATGLDEAVARSAVKDAIAESGWSALDAARRLVTARKLTGAKAARFLASRGFEEDVVERVIGSGGGEI
ncbi:MAG: RecX family transcriptional regulator [Archangium sp.]|nr:RecX family transcriptional regulator [Archangium sp.]